jgi:hypothetical protein
MEVSHIMDVRGKLVAGVHMDDPRYWLDGLGSVRQ